MPAVQRRRGTMSEINIVPYVDVMLVLLVIFMVTAPLVTPGVVELPSVSKAPVAPVAPLEVIIKEDLSVLLRSRDAKGGAGEERLVATAIGLFAAIPAVVAYNRYSHDIDRLANRFESFMEEFSNILHRQAVR